MSTPTTAHANRVRLLSVTILFVISAYLVYQHQLDRAVEDHLADVRHAGAPTTIAELRAQIPEPPAGENAVLAMFRALDQFAAAPETLRDLPLLGGHGAPRLESEFDDRTRQSMELFLRDHAAVFEGLGRATALERGQTPLNLTSGATEAVSARDLARLRQAIRLLQFAAVARASNGQATAAGESVIQAFMAIRLTGKHPFLVGYINHRLDLEQGLEVLDYVQRHSQLTPAQWARLETELAALDDPAALAFALVSDRCMTSDRYAARDISLPYLSLRPAAQGQDPEQDARLGFSPLFGLHCAAGTVQKSQMAFLTGMQHLIDASQSEPALRSMRIEGALKEIHSDPRLAVIIGSLYNHFDRLIARDDLITARLDKAREQARAQASRDSRLARATP